MKKTKRLWALFLAVVMALGLITTAFAAPTIDSGRKASLSLYKYDITAASADGAWDAASYVSTGVQDDAVTDKLAKYAIQGVEFSYLRVASISTYSQRESGQYKVGVLYGFADDAVLRAIGLTKADAYKRGNGVFYFTSDKLNKALADALVDNATTVKMRWKLPSATAARLWRRRMQPDIARSSGWSRACIWWWRPVCRRMSPAPVTRFCFPAHDHHGRQKLELRCDRVPEESDRQPGPRKDRPGG